MGLSSVFQTARSGMAAAEAVLAVAADNLANSNTNGFKQSRVVTTTQTPATQSLGFSPRSGSRGSNPVQIGTGVQVGTVSTDFSQGSIVTSSNPLDVALEGNGFFIVQSEQGETLYTRKGNFQINGAGQLVTGSGDRVLGFGIDENYDIDTTRLVPLEIRSGKTAPRDDGSAAILTGFTIEQDGRILGKFDDGVSRDLGQIQIARFANPDGLQARGEDRYASAPNSGLPVPTTPGENGGASLQGGASELSNTDLGQNLIDTILAESQFQGNLLVFDTAESMIEALTFLRR